MTWDQTIPVRLNIQYPIIQAPMLGITTPGMVVAIAEAGGLGSLPVGGLSPETTLQLIRKVKAGTGKPFAVNLFTHDIPAIDINETDAMQDFLEALSDEHYLGYERQDVAGFKFHTYKEQIEILVRENITAVSFTFGIPDDESIAQLKSAGILLIGTATSVKEALLLESKGIDMIVAQGIEAGGHRGSFLDDEPLPQVGTLALVPQICDRVTIPVIAAGGIYNGVTIRAAFVLGAVGVQIGSAFLASPESSAIPAFKTALPGSTETDSELTRAFSGRWARGLRNSFMEAMANSGLQIPVYPVQNSLTGKLRAYAQQKDKMQFTSLWAGQAAAQAKPWPAADIFNDLVRQVEAAYPQPA
ncbi:NAD(P)H-dependent flavin oxidoreductase [Taibaiella chishuiensis]|uniref:Nitronate monooxygenase n=1 Tax=Taibaiella chishuiensis TaxID=1434707 RepID=A0A2P8CSQ9_9BACT|nr:nitronate monooxygenase [Taibaiella chishuiensis]PSK87998.1 nitronate monooxygenase [Taibaiella chishuiensis]